jgi:hypothetical protein
MDDKKKMVQIRRQYFCLCDGQQEELYLKHLAGLLKTDNRRITFTTAC